MFHVEHTPVEKSTPSSGSFLQKLVNFRIDNLRGKLFSQVRNPGGRSTSDTPFRIGARCPNTQRYGCRRSLRHGRQKEIVCSVGDQRFASPRTERAAATQEERGLKKAGLARRIRADEQIGFRIEFEFDSRQATKPLGAESAEWHASPYKRIGITTYRALVAPGARTRQLELPSVTPISTSLPSTAAKASRR